MLYRAIIRIFISIQAIQNRWAHTTATLTRLKEHQQGSFHFKLPVQNPNCSHGSTTVAPSSISRVSVMVLPQAKHTKFSRWYRLATIQTGTAQRNSSWSIREPSTRLFCCGIKKISYMDSRMSVILMHKHFKRIPRRYAQAMNEIS